MHHSRRNFLALASLAPAALLVAGSANAAGQACYDPNTLPLSQKTRRRGLGYVEPSPDSTKHCGGCAFFTAAEPSCGSCQMLSGGPVSALAVCNSFAPRS